MLVLAFIELLQDMRKKEEVLKTDHSFKDKNSPFFLFLCLSADGGPSPRAALPHFDLQHPG